jgi:hypothetical protein
MGRHPLPGFVPEWIVPPAPPARIGCQGCQVQTLAPPDGLPEGWAGTFALGGLGAGWRFTCPACSVHFGGAVVGHHRPGADRPIVVNSRDGGFDATIAEARILHGALGGALAIAEAYQAGKAI